MRMKNMTFKRSHLRKKSLLECALAVQQGVSVEELEAWIKGYAPWIARPVVLNVLGISEALLRRHRQLGKPLEAKTADRLWCIESITSRAAEVFGSRAQALEWISRPALALNNHVPLSLAASSPGRECVLTCLEQIESGTYL